MSLTSAEAFAVLAGAHAAFQLTVSVVVYPALRDVPDHDWSRAHDAHSRRISYLVAVLYPALLAGCAWLLLDGPVGTGGTGLLGVALGLGGTALAFAATAFAAAPTHGRLGAGRTDALIARLLLADRVRTLGSLIGLAGAVVLLV
ncbi:hypothetical protein [Nocardioides sp.]|uniref:hypothetical protein n=1 Tax=Nocardioides sp. TaxID=35761 RepID=UPI0035145417